MRSWPWPQPNADAWESPLDPAATQGLGGRPPGLAATVQGAGERWVAGRAPTRARSDQKRGERRRLGPSQCVQRRRHQYTILTAREQFSRPDHAARTVLEAAIGARSTPVPAARLSRAEALRLAATLGLALALFELVALLPDWEGDITHYKYWTHLITVRGIWAAYSGTWPETYAIYPPVLLYAFRAVGVLYRAAVDPAFDLAAALDSQPLTWFQIGRAHI